ncbi:MAG: ABC transporter permease [Hyphomicrobiaceae bacterium]
MRATLNTLEVALGSSAIALLVGGGLAILLASSRLATRRAIAFLLILSVMIAPQVAALAFKTLAGPASPILKAMALAPPPGTRNPLLGSFGIILVMGLHHAPLVAITLAGGLAAIPRSLIEAAQLDGASAPRILISVLLPLLRPYAVAAALLVFVAGVGNFGIPALLGLPVGYVTLPTLIYQKLASFGPRLITDAAALSLLVGSIAAMGVVAALALSPREATRLDADERLAPFLDFGRGRLVVEGAVWLFLAVTILLPMLSLLATALVPAYGVALTWDTFTLSRFTEVLIRQSVTLRALTNSLMLAGSAAVSLAVLSILIGYAVERRGKRWRVPALTLIEMPYALPGVVLAIACILLFLKPLPLIGISLYATPWIILFAYHARFLPVVLKPVLAALATQERDSEDAAAVYGASLLQRLCYVIVPHVLPAAVAGGMLAFLFAFNELTVSALLWSAGTETIGVALLSLEDAGLGAEAAAIGVVTIVVVATLMFVLDALHRWFPRDVLPWRIIAR